MDEKKKIMVASLNEADKITLTAEQVVEAKDLLTAQMEAIATCPNTTESQMMFSALANAPYDAELPYPEIVSELCLTASVEKGEDYEYFTIGAETKTVVTVTNGSVTQTNVTPDSENDLTFNTYDSPEYYVYLEKILEAKYDAVKLKAKTAMEAVDRKEVKDVLDVAIASAVAQGNTFALDSGDSVLDLPKVLEIKAAVEDYGTNFVIVAGSTVKQDIDLLNYNADKNQAINLAAYGIIKVIKAPALTYTHSTVQTVMAADKMILVALSDSNQMRPIHFVRRKVQGIEGAGDKERVMINLGPRIHTSAAKWGMSFIVAEQYGVVQPNPYATAVFKRAASYS